MRDSLSILDQAAALMNNNINIEKLLEMLGLQNYNEFYKLFLLCLKSEALTASKKYDEFILSGISPIQITSNLIEICGKSSRHSIDYFDSNDEQQISKYLTEISDFGITHLIRSMASTYKRP